MERPGQTVRSLAFAYVLSPGTARARAKLERLGKPRVQTLINQLLPFRAGAMRVGPPERRCHPSRHRCTGGE